MAQRVQVLLVCDLHDEEVEGAETVAFGLDGAAYELDACEEHAAAMRDAFAPYVGAARRAGRGGAAAPPRRRSAPGRRRRRRAAAGRTSRRSASGRGPTATRSASAAGCPALSSAAYEAAH